MTSFFRVRPGSTSTSGLRSSSPPPSKTRRGEAPRIQAGLLVRGDRGCRGVEPVDRRAVAEQVRSRRPAQRCKIAAPLVLMKEGSQSVAILAVGNSGTPISSRTRRRSKGTVGYRCSSPRRQQPNERCLDSSDRLEARCNLKDASTLCYAVLRCVALCCRHAGAEMPRAGDTEGCKAAGEKPRASNTEGCKATGEGTRASNTEGYKAAGGRVPVTQKAIRRLKAACRPRARSTEGCKAAGEVPWDSNAEGCKAAGGRVPVTEKAETRLDAGVSRQYEIGGRKSESKKGG
ncbi:hypothetical protein Bbelb_327020 [Branchiostoma belcheri]|nr:hypothetical protein Bbelb_327020 [Branchiostoma belcheri]